ncbi:MAG: hypothetical protein NTX25_11805 [Proteobacteria bacterium]|nr:hypothetical protein [Pseudomonadota bacterium]
MNLLPQPCCKKVLPWALTGVFFTVAACKAKNHDSNLSSIQADPNSNGTSISFLTEPDFPSQQAGQQIILKWTVQGASRLEVIGNGIPLFSGDIWPNTPARGRLAVAPMVTTSYTLNAWDAEGRGPYSRSINLTVEDTAPKIVYFRTLKDTNLQAGDEITLEWRTENAISASLNGPGVNPRECRNSTLPLDSFKFTLANAGNYRLTVFSKDGRFDVKEVKLNIVSP